MKKLFLTFLILALTLTICACQKEEVNDSLIEETEDEEIDRFIGMGMARGYECLELCPVCKRYQTFVYEGLSDMGGILQITCTKCGKEIYRKIGNCPNCGERTYYEVDGFDFNGAIVKCLHCGEFGSIHDWGNIQNDSHRTR